MEKSILLIRSNHAGVRYKLIDTLRGVRRGVAGQARADEQICGSGIWNYYLQLAQRSEDAWSGPRQIYWFVRMRQEHDNVRVALEHALRTPGEAVRR